MGRINSQQGKEYLTYLYKLERTVVKYLTAYPSSKEVIEAYETMCELVGVEPEKEKERDG